MEQLALVPAALDSLGVATTATAPADPDYHIYREWCDGTAEKRSAMLLKKNDLTAILYWNNDLDFQAISMIAEPANCLQRDDWCVGQFGTCLSRGSEPIRFNGAEVCGEIVVPMREPYTKELELVYDVSRVVTATNCTLWADFDADKDFPGDGDLCMATLPLVIPFGQGAVVPQSFYELIDSIEAADDRPQILNGKPAPGLADALKALKKNEFHSFFGTKNKYGMEEKYFHKDFKKIAEKPLVYNNMMVEEKNVTGFSPNGRHHNILFVDKLNKALRYAQGVCPSKYDEALDQYVNLAKKATRKVKFAQLQDDNISTDSDDSTHTRKRGKQEDTSMNYMTRFYTFILGIQVNANDQG